MATPTGWRPCGTVLRATATSLVGEAPFASELLPYRERTVEIRIGVSQSMKEIEVDLGEVDRDATVAEITATLANAEGTLWLTDKKGRSVGVPVAKVAYVEIGGPSEERKVGFAR